MIARADVVTASALGVLRENRQRFSCLGATVARVPSPLLRAHDMPSSVNDRASYWDRYGEGVAHESSEEALKNAFGWTQYSGHGPGEELLGGPITALELGSGGGDAVAALATKGITATGVDLSASQCEHARSRWGHLPSAHFEQGDVIDYLSATDQRWDAIYSIWGAVWFTDPDHLLPLVREHLNPGGRLVFSHAPAVPGSYGLQGIYGAGFNGPKVWLYRWSYEPDTWTTILRTHGFTQISSHIEPAPRADHVGTLITHAHRPEVNEPRP